MGGCDEAHELAPPDPGFRARLRALSEAAAAMRHAHARALEAGLAWRPVAGSDRARPPYELRPGTGRHGPDELWTQFDAAVEQLNAAGGGRQRGRCRRRLHRCRRRRPCSCRRARGSGRTADALTSQPAAAIVRSASDRSAVPAEHVVRDRNALRLRILPRRRSARDRSSTARQSDAAQPSADTTQSRRE
jgi:hypothetical protein